MQLEAGEQQLVQQQHQGVSMAQHGPYMATYLLVNGIMAPGLLAQPYTFAVLSWPGAIIINLLMAAASWYCLYHQSVLFHHRGRNSTYKIMGDAILGPTRLGPWGGWLIAGLQYFINIGTTITNMILAGQLLQSVYTNLCTDTAACGLTSTSAWIGITAALSYAIYLGLPDMGSLAWASICGTLFVAYYSAAAVAMAILDGHSSDAVYAIDGPPADRVFNALNGVGMLLFMYGITVAPEIQDVLQDHPKTGSTTRYMIQATTAAHCLFVPLYMVVGAVGYWAYGAAVNPFLLFANSHPRGLVVSAELAAAIQVQLVSQVLMLPVFDASERLLMARLGGRMPWLVRKPPPAASSPDSPAAAAAAAAALRPASPSSPAYSMHSHMSSLANHMASFTHSLSGSFSIPHHHHHTHQLTRHHSSSNDHHSGPLHGCMQHSRGGPGELRTSSHTAQQRRLSSPASLQERHSSCNSSPLAVPAAAAAGPWCGSDPKGAHNHTHTRLHQMQPADPAAAPAGQQDPVGQQAEEAVAQQQPSARPSLLLLFLNRTLITLLLAFVACALPFFSAIMGFFGAVGFGPMTYALPTCLYMVAFRHKLSRREWCANAAFVAFWLLTSLTAAVGAMYSIVSSASTYRFFS